MSVYVYIDDQSRPTAGGWFTSCNTIYHWRLRCKFHPHHMTFGKWARERGRAREPRHVHTPQLSIVCKRNNKLKTLLGCACVRVCVFAWGCVRVPAHKHNIFIKYHTVCSFCLQIYSLFCISFTVEINEKFPSILCGLQISVRNHRDKRMVYALVSCDDVFSVLGEIYNLILSLYLQEICKFINVNYELFPWITWAHCPAAHMTALMATASNLHIPILFAHWWEKIITKFK